jgi:hypothetical protein
MDTTMNMGDEPGSQDNRITLRPADFPMTEDWKDGETYSLSELGNAKIRQIAAGEFELIPAAAAGSPPEGEEPGTTEQPQGGANEEDKEPDPGNYPNPAVSRMMRKGRSTGRSGY